MTQNMREQQVGHRCQAHRRTRVAITDFLDGVHCQCPKMSDRVVIYFIPVQRIAHGISLVTDLPKGTPQPKDFKWLVQVPVVCLK